MNSIYSADISILCDTPKQAKVLFDSIAPESQKFKTERSTAELKIKGKDLKIKIEAKDLTAMRASFNSVFRLLSTTENIMELEVN